MRLALPLQQGFINSFLLLWRPIDKIFCNGGKYLGQFLHYFRVKFMRYFRVVVGKGRVSSSQDIAVFRIGLGDPFVQIQKDVGELNMDAFNAPLSKLRFIFSSLPRPTPKSLDDFP